VTVGVLNDVVQQHTDLIAETLVVLFVPVSEDELKRTNQMRNHFRIDGKLPDGFFAANFDKVPKHLNCKRDYVGAEVTLLLNEMHELSA